MRESIKKFINQLLSIDESRKSIVVMMLILITSVGIYKFIKTGDFNSNITSIILTISGYVFGINISNSVCSMISNYSKNNTNVINTMNTLDTINTNNTNLSNNEYNQNQDNPV